MDKITFFSKKKTLNCKGNIIYSNKPLIMGILNLTPDSFFDGGNYQSVEKAILQTDLMLKQGADIIDLGAISTRPGAKSISENDEAKRLFPVLKEITKTFPNALISIDTYRASIADKALEMGAHIINDISGGEYDSNMFEIVAKHNAPYIFMHIKGTPENMQQNPEYDNIMQEISNYFATKINKLKESGVNDIIIDSGFGFGKTLKHNYEILRKLDELNMFELPILVGVSRKSMINQIIKTNADEALNGSTVIHTIALLKGANILRVHDVKEAKEVVELVNFYNEY